MTEAVTPPNPDQSDSGRHGNPPQAVPDPTLMTIDALRREIAVMNNLVDAKFQATENLALERIARIDALMVRAEEMRQEQKADTRQAVEAALESQKEASAKMEASMASQLASLRDNFETSIRGVQSSIADLKDRMTTLESVKQGASEQRTERRQISAGVVASIGVGVAALVAVITVLSFMAGGT